MGGAEIIMFIKLGQLIPCLQTDPDQCVVEWRSLPEWRWYHDGVETDEQRLSCLRNNHHFISSLQQVLQGISCGAEISVNQCGAEIGSLWS